MARQLSRPAQGSDALHGVSLSHPVTVLSRYLVGWRDYFGFCETPMVLHSIDQW